MMSTCRVELLATGSRGGRLAAVDEVLKSVALQTSMNRSSRCFGQNDASANWTLIIRLSIEGAEHGMMNLIIVQVIIRLIEVLYRYYLCGK